MAAPLREAVPPLDERAHEREVEAFLSSLDGRRRRWIYERHPVLSEVKVRLIRKHEVAWAGDQLDELLVVNPSLERGLAPPNYVPGGVHRTAPALNLGRRVFTDEIEEGAHARPGDAALWRPPRSGAAETA